jgi:hypothetical protein
MAQQGELFPKAEATIRLDGSRGEPRLWVRRIVLWEKPGEIIRDIRLRRGLNIVWSPDPGAKQAELGFDAGSGHGAGKTLFCRLLRYCLGEDTFSNDEQWRSIAELLPAGLVGVEVVIEGKTWSVIRPIDQTRKHRTSFLRVRTPPCLSGNEQGIIFEGENGWPKRRKYGK